MSQLFLSGSIDVHLDILTSHLTCSKHMLGRRLLALFSS